MKTAQQWFAEYGESHYEFSILSAHLENQDVMTTTIAQTENPIAVSGSTNPFGVNIVKQEPLKNATVATINVQRSLKRSISFTIGCHSE